MQSGAQRERVAVAHHQRQQAAGRQHPRQPREQRVGLLDVHQHPVAQHHVEAARQEVHAGVPAVALHDPHPLPDALRLAGQRLTRDRDHRGVPLHAGHLVPGPGQPQRLGALAHPDVEHAQPPAHGEAPGYLLVQLPGHQLLPYDVAKPGQSCRPGLGRVPGERRRAQGRSPRLTWGFGSRRRRIWSERISA